MRKILYVANSGHIIGGGQVSLLALLKRLNRDLYQPVAVCPSEGELCRELKALGVKVFIIPMPSLRRFNPVSFTRGIAKFLNLIKREDIDLIHSNGSRCTIYSGIAARLRRVPLVWHVRIAETDRYLDRFLGRLATKILVISRAVGRRFYWMRRKEGKVVVVYNGIDVEEFNPGVDGRDIRGEFNIGADTAVVGVIGRFTPEKGHRFFIEAAAEVSRNIPNLKIMLVGRGEGEGSLRELVERLSMAERVIFTGFRKDLPEVIAATDIIVLPSLNEGFGRSLVEAMAMGKAVVATSVGGVPEIVSEGETGLLVPPEAPGLMAEAVIGLLGDKDRASKMGRAGRLRAEGMFSLAANVEMTEAVYEELLVR